MIDPRLIIVFFSLAIIAIGIVITDERKETDDAE